MPSYKLTYFNVRGRAELIRLIFAAAGVPYEDVRLEMEQWPAVKPTTPFGQIPTLQVDDIMLCQTNSIGRYLARKYGLGGKTDMEQVFCDIVIDALEDIGKSLTAIYYEPEEKRKEEMRKKFSEDQLPTFLKNLEKLYLSNNDGTGYFVGDSLTWADLALLNLSSWLTLVQQQDALENYPQLKALADRIAKEPKIAEWIAKRPVTEY